MLQVQLNVCSLNKACHTMDAWAKPNQAEHASPGKFRRLVLWINIRMSTFVLFYQCAFMLYIAMLIHHISGIVYRLLHVNMVCPYQYRFKYIVIRWINQYPLVFSRTNTTALREPRPTTVRTPESRLIAWRLDRGVTQQIQKCDGSTATFRCVMVTKWWSIEVITILCVCYNCIDTITSPCIVSL